MVYVPRPPFVVSLDVQPLLKFLNQFENLKNKPITGGIAVYGAAAAYALVPEYGWPQGPGPRTLWGTNAKGLRAIMSKQAPTGYVAIHEQEMLPIILEELGKVDFNTSSENELRLRLEVAIDNADQRIARLVADSAPVDSGDLRAGVDIIDSSLDEGQANLFF